jgi:epoxyqueuosine reductase QueG
LELKLAALAVAEGADFLGCGDMTGAYALAERVSGKALPANSPRLPRVISIGVRLSEELVDSLPRNMGGYSQHFYSTMWPKAKVIARKLGDCLKADGHRVLYGLSGLDGLPKMAARLSGLGWIGKSCLLVTPEVGPRAAWEAVLTDAPIRPTTAKPMERQCGDCRRCQDICPAKAIPGTDFAEDQPLAARFKAELCEKHRQSFGNIFTDGACGLCLKVCPFGCGQDLLVASSEVP